MKDTAELDAWASRALSSPEALRDAPPDPALLERVRALSEAVDEAARVAWVRYARRVEGAAAREAVVRCARDASASVRRLALASLAREHHAPEHAVLLVEALGDVDDVVARTALIGLCEHFEVTGGVADALVRFAKERDANQAGRVGLVLSRVGDVRAVALLLSAVESGSHFWHNAGRRPWERAETFAALAELGARAEVEPALVRGVREDDWVWGKQAAWEGLSRWWAPEQMHALYQASEPATQRPSRPPRSGFDAEAARSALFERYSPQLNAEDADVRAEACAVVRWIKLPEVSLPAVETARSSHPGCAELERLHRDLSALGVEM